MTSGSRALGVLGTLVVGSACGDDRPRPPRADVVPVTSTVRETVPAGDAPPTVTLLTPGAEPRAARRVAFEAGTTTTRVSTVSLNTVSQDGRPARTFPADVTSIDLAVSIDAAPGSGATGIAKVANIEMQSAEAPKSVPEATALIGTTWRLAVGTRNEITSLTAPGVEGDKVMILREDVANAVRAMFVPLPEEPIGIGATWRVVVTLAPPTGGTRTETTTYELVGETDGVLELAATGAATAAAPGVTAEASSHGTVLVSWRAWQPARAALFKRAKILITQNGPTVTVDQEGRQEIAPSGAEIPTMRASCEQADACCKAIRAELAPPQRDTCTAAIRSKDVAACSEQFSTMQRAVLLMGRRVPACQ